MMINSRDYLRLLIGCLFLFISSSYAFMEPAPAEISAIRLLSVGENSVVLDFYAPRYHIEMVQTSLAPMQRISVPGSAFTQEVGRPELPVLSAVIGAPAEARIVLKTLVDEVSLLPGQYDIVPVAQFAPLQQDFQIGQRVSFPDVNFYGRDEQYPGEPVRLAGDAWLRDQRILRIEVSPFQYNPARKELIWHQHMRVSVQFLDGDGQEKRETRSIESVYPGSEMREAFEGVLSRVLLNYDQAKAWRRVATNGKGLTITPSLSQVDGPRFRIVVNQDGIYRLTCSDLEKVGMAIGAGGVDPRTFSMSSQGQQVAIFVEGEDDGVCNDGDRVVFYGQKFSGDRLAERYANENRHWLTYTQQSADGSSTPWKPSYNAVMVEKYTDENIYWLSVGGQPGPRMDTVSGDPTGSVAPIPSSYQARVHAERSLQRWTWHFQGEDTWFWERVQGPVTTTYTTTLSALANGSYTANVRVRIGAVSSNDFDSPDHWTRFTLNDWPAPLDDALWDGRSSYIVSASIPQAVLREGVNELHFQALYDPDKYPSLVYPDYYFDWFEITYQRRFEAQGDQLFFPVEADGVWKYQISGFSVPQAEVYDVSDPVAPKRVLGAVGSGVPGNYSISFLTGAGSGAQMLVAAPSAMRSPKGLSYYNPPDLRSPSNGADYLFITPADFVSAIWPLVDLRVSQGLRVKVIGIHDIYNEFSDGIANPLAIKEFLRYAFQAWQPPAPSYVLLVGDGHWNPRGFNPEQYGSDPVYILPNLAWVDPWLGEVDDTNSLASIVGEDPLPDILIGRLPVNSATELQAIVEKILSYEESGAQEWQQRLLFVADDTPDEAGDFVAKSEALIEKYLAFGRIVDRVYLDQFKDTDTCEKPSPGSNTCPAANRSIREALNTRGALLITYFGHASIRSWASEQIWTLSDVSALTNEDRLPVILSMTCLDGYWFGPVGGVVSYGPSLAEEMLRKSKKGAVGAFSPGGLGVGTGHDALADGFYQALFEQGVWRLGQAVLAAKLSLYTTGADYDLLHTYTLLGDPALQIASAYDGRTLYFPLLRK